MAKVRIQARTADVKEDELPSHGPHQTASKSPGAVDVLVNAWKKDGPLGWYQVRQRRSSLLRHSDHIFFPGHAITNYQGRSFAGLALHVKGSVRTMDPRTCGITGTPQTILIISFFKMYVS